MAANVNTAPSALWRFATKFGALIIGPRSNKETGATTTRTGALVSLVNAGATIGISSGIKTIVDGSATALFDVACLPEARCGGTILATVEASDGTDHQAMSVVVTYAAVNKAGTLTLTITDLATVDARAVSSGTLTLAWTLVTGTGKATVKLQPTGSLTETAYTVTFTVISAVGAVTLV